MTTVRSLGFLDCPKCGPKSLHDYGICRECGQQNHASGQPKTARPANAGFNTLRAAKFDPAIEERGRARRAARQARHKISARTT
jgi:hypothetical protein